MEHPIPAPYTPSAVSPRLQSIDALRGLVMIIMALDHVRDLLHTTALTQSPTDLNTTTPLLFFSRWITHLCAPTFVFLSGAAAYLYLSKNNNSRQGRSFLCRRGLWLILLEFTLINFALWFDFKFRLLMLQVIAAIGAGLIIVAFLAKVKPVIPGALALVIIFCHNLLQYVPAAEDAFSKPLMNLFFQPGIINFSSGFMFFIAYPLIPWIALMLLGFSMGRIFLMPQAMQTKRWLQMGLLSLAVFTILRWLNFYGDPTPWATGKSAVFTFLSFINLTKYPPSLQYSLFFLSLAFLLLALFTKRPFKWANILVVYGKVPLFYYVLHLYFIRVALFIMVFAQGFRWNDLLFGPFQFGRPASNSGIGLGMIYIVWLLIVLLLYPLCKWFGKYKARNNQRWWVHYI